MKSVIRIALGVYVKMSSVPQRNIVFKIVLEENVAIWIVAVTYATNVAPGATVRKCNALRKIVLRCVWATVGTWCAILPSVSSTVFLVAVIWNVDKM